MKVKHISIKKHRSIESPELPIEDYAALAIANRIFGDSNVAEFS
jgi:hypothetical protein